MRDPFLKCKQELAVVRGLAPLLPAVVPFLFLLWLTSCESAPVVQRIKHESTAVEVIPEVVRLPRKQPVVETPTTFEINAPCAVYFSPTDDDLRGKKDSATDDEMWYTSESYTFFTAKGLPTLEAEQKTVRFHLSNGELKEFSNDKDTRQWNIVLFDGKSTVSVIQAIDAEEAFERLFN